MSNDWCPGLIHMTNDFWKPLTQRPQVCQLREHQALNTKLPRGVWAFSDNKQPWTRSHFWTHCVEEWKWPFVFLLFVFLDLLLLLSISLCIRSHLDPLSDQSSFVYLPIRFVLLSSPSTLSPPFPFPLCFCLHLSLSETPSYPPLASLGIVCGA